jgi:cytochrome c oxidase subunit 3
MSRAVTLKEPFRDPVQQRTADYFGMYVFLGSEIMLFGGLFAALATYRIAHPQAAVEAAHHFKLWLGTANTAVLLTSSLFVALGVESARTGERRRAGGWFIAAAVLGVAFLAIKGTEYLLEYREGLMPRVGPASPLKDRASNLFVDLYFVATGLHAVHLLIGVTAMTVVAGVYGLRRRPPPAVVAEMTGLYWHLVDVIWVFLFPVLYLAR